MAAAAARPGFRIGDDLLRDGRDTAGPEDLLGEMLVEGSGRGIETFLKSGREHCPAVLVFGNDRFRPMTFAEDRAQAFHRAEEFGKDGNAVGKGLFLEGIGLVPPADEPDDDRFAGGPDL